MSGAKVDMDMTGLDVVNAAVSRMPMAVREAVDPVLKDAAQEIADKASSIARTTPSGLWTDGRGRLLTPSYRMTKKGEGHYKVSTPSGAVGKAEQMSEFARLAVTSQGAALVRVLDRTYGRPGGSGGGRILWQAADSITPGLLSKVEKAAADAARKDVEG